MLTCYSPVRRSCTPKGLTARLACVKHAASVRPEPGSNSPLNSCASHSEAADNSLVFLSRQETILTIVRIIVSYQRNRRHKRPANRIANVERVINSSTFGTLLSSQGSSAHRSQASRPFRGATCKNLPGPTCGVKSVRPVPAPSHGTLSSAVRRPLMARTRTTSVEVCSWGFARVGRPTSRPCVPPLRGNEMKH